MTLDELEEQMRAVSGDAIGQRMTSLVKDWKSDDATVEQLHSSVERCIECYRYDGSINYEEIHRLWSSFRKEVIGGIGGMTMNERLYYFGLFSRFDKCETEEARGRLYEKLLSTP